MEENNNEQEKFRAEQVEEKKIPYSVYQKTIMGKVSGLRLNPISMLPQDYILIGDLSDPTSDLEETKVINYTKSEHDYFIRKNKSLIQRGILMQVKYTDDFRINTINQVTEDEIKELLKDSDALRKRLDEFTSPVPVRRIREFALSRDADLVIMDMTWQRLQELEVL